MAQLCSICCHDDRLAMEKALIGGESFRAIAGRWQVSRSALERHKANHVAKALARIQNAVSDARSMDVVTEIQRVLERVNLLFDACDRWLRDPDNPDAYDIGPRADDINVIVWEKGPSGQQVQKKRKMSYLLDKLEEGGVVVERWDTKHADPRDLVLKTADSLKGQMEFLSKLAGTLAPDASIKFTIKVATGVAINADV